MSAYELVRAVAAILVIAFAAAALGDLRAQSTTARAPWSEEFLDAAAR